MTALKARVEEKLYMGKKGKRKEAAKPDRESALCTRDFSKIFTGKDQYRGDLLLVRPRRFVKSRFPAQFYSYNHPNREQRNTNPAGDVMTMYADNDLRKEHIDRHAQQPEFHPNKIPAGRPDPAPMVICVTAR